MQPDPETRELTVTSIHQGVTREQISENTGWLAHFASEVARTSPPSETELMVLRDLQARSELAHSKPQTGGADYLPHEPRR